MIFENCYGIFIHTKEIVYLCLLLLQSNILCLRRRVGTQQVVHLRELVIVHNQSTHGHNLEIMDDIVPLQG